MYFLQKIGTAMGTSSACEWATLYYGVHTRWKLLSCQFGCQLKDSKIRIQVHRYIYVARITAPY